MLSRTRSNREQPASRAEVGTDDQDLERAAPARTREQLADVATLIWVVFWGSLIWQLFQFLIGFSAVGRAVHASGESMIERGQSLGSSLAGPPVVGSQVRDIASGAFEAGGRPISPLGTELEQFVTIMSVVLALLLALVTPRPVAHALPAMADGAASPGALGASGDPDRAGLGRQRPEDARNAGNHAARLRDPARLHAGPGG